MYTSLKWFQMLIIQWINKIFKKQFTLYSTSFSLLSCLERYQLSAFLGMKNALATAISHPCVCEGEHALVKYVFSPTQTELCLGDCFVPLMTWPFSGFVHGPQISVECHYWNLEKRMFSTIKRKKPINRCQGSFCTILNVIAPI